MSRLATLLFLILLAAPTFANEPFDHFSTGFELDGAHANVTCERCHTGGKFEGTNPACVSCHSAIGAVQALEPGVYIAMNGTVWLPEEVRKNVRANRFEHV